jgi:hypothetical protein
MQLQPHVTQVAEQLAATAALGDERTREVAHSLAAAAAPAVRLALLGAVTRAADEITAHLVDQPGSPAVTVRLDGDELAVDVAATDPAGPDELRRDDGEPTARISLRLTEALKADIDAAAERDGVSVNTWLVRAAAAALRSGPFDRGMPGLRAGGSRITGWING